MEVVHEAILINLLQKKIDDYGGERDPLTEPYANVFRYYLYGKHTKARKIIQAQMKN